MVLEDRSETARLPLGGGGKRVLKMKRDREMEKWRGRISH